MRSNRQSDQSSGFTRTKRVLGLTLGVSWLSFRNQKYKASEKLVQGLQELGGIYTKFLQILVNLMPDFPGVTDDIRHNVFSKPSYQDVDVIDALGSNLDANDLMRISQIQNQPFASGSFAQVYEALLDNQMPVIIKILRPHIRRQLKTDLRLLAVLARLAQPLIRSDIVSTVRLYKDYKRTVMQEISYRKEVESALLMAEEYAGNTKIVIPTTYTELCTPEIIVQEKLEGISLSSLLQQAGGNGSLAIEIAKSQLGTDIIDQLSELGFSLISSSIEGPYMYGDPHPGNIIFMRDGRVGIIDFGVILPQVVNPYDLYDVLANEGLMNYDHNASTNIAEHILKVFRLYNPKIYRALERLDKDIKSTSLLQELVELVDRIIEPSKNMIRNSYNRGLGIPTRVIMDALNGKDQNNRFGLMAYEPTARLARAQSQFWNAAEQLGLIRETSVEVHRKLREKFNNIIDSFKKEESMSFSEASEIINDWFTELMQRDPLLFRELFAKIRKTLQEYEKEPSNA